MLLTIKAATHGHQCHYRDVQRGHRVLVVKCGLQKYGALIKSHKAIGGGKAHLVLALYLCIQLSGVSVLGTQLLQD